MIALLLVLLTWGQNPGPAQEIRVGSVVLQTFDHSEYAGEPTNTLDGTLVTAVQDPGHPDEPWVVTTYRRPDESTLAFVRRHKDIVDAVREALEA